METNNQHSADYLFSIRTKTKTKNLALNLNFDIHVQIDAQNVVNNG